MLRQQWTLKVAGAQAQSWGCIETRHVTYLNHFHTAASFFRIAL